MQIQRERLEASKLLDQASKRDWSFAAPHRMPQELHLLCDFSLSSEKRPQQWTQAVAALIEKEKGASELKHFRPISLLSHVHKLYCKWLMLRVQGRVEE